LEGGYLSQKDSKEIDLKELIKQSSHIYLAEKGQPPKSIKKIKIHENIERYPPFNMKVHHFKVVKELFNNKRLPIPGGEINVYSADWEIELSKHKKRYLKNFIIENERPNNEKLNYSTDTDFNSKNLILFLRYEEENNFVFSANHAYESIVKHDEILNILKRKSLPKIHRELKTEVLEQIPPNKAYFTYIPGMTKEDELLGFIGNYFQTQELRDMEEDNNVKKIKLYITSDSIKIMLDHCYLHGRKKEVMGLMLGMTFKYNDNIYSVVKDVVTSDLDATEVNVRFDSFDKLFEQLHKISYNYQIIGWYHSHPNYSSYMSPTDAKTQARMFHHQFQYAMVIDPIRYDMNAFVFDQSAMKNIRERPYAIVSSEEFKSLFGVKDLKRDELESKLLLSEFMKQFGR
jgi:proteasome lid subunit RPN8/RPN11